MINEHDLEAFDYYDMVRNYNEFADNDRDPSLYFKLIQEEFVEFVNSNTLEEDLKELCDLMYVLMGYAWSCGYDVNKAFLKVHKNNMERMLHPDGSVHRRTDGKIIKNPDTPKVDLGDCV